MSKRGDGMFMSPPRSVVGLSGEGNERSSPRLQPQKPTNSPGLMHPLSPGHPFSVSNPSKNPISGVSQSNVLRSSDLTLPLKIKIDNLEGGTPSELLDFIGREVCQMTESPSIEVLRDLVVEAQIFSDNRPLSLLERTSYTAGNKTRSFIWNQWLTFSCKYSELTEDAVIAITVWNVYGPNLKLPLGSCVYPLFNEQKMMKRGKHKILLRRYEVANSEWNSESFLWEPNSTPTKLEKTLRKFDQRDVSPVGWLDRHTYRQVERIKEENNFGEDDMMLTVEFVSFHPKEKSVRVVLHEEKTLFDHSSQSRLPTSGGRPDLIASIANSMVVDEDVVTADIRTKPYGDLVEAKFFRLSHLRPNADEESRLRQISRLRAEIGASSTNTGVSNGASQPVLTSDDESLLWRFKFWLMRQTTPWGKALLACVLRTVDWDSPHHRKDAAVLLRNWPRPEVADLLELLSPNFGESLVRNYAVECLESHLNDDPSEVLICLPQLVEACRYDSPPLSSKLKDLIVNIALKHNDKACLLFWYLKVAKSECPTDDPQVKKQRLIMKQLFDYYEEALNDSFEAAKLQKMIREQEEFVSGIEELCDKIKKGSRDKREEKAKTLMHSLSEGPYSYLSNLANPLHLPLDSEVIVGGVIPENVGIFKSAMAPFRLPMKCLEGSKCSSYTIIYKNGDDLRQDQLVMQFIDLIDRVWKREGLDLQLTKYKVLATGAESGMVECVQNCDALQRIITTNGDIVSYLAEKNAPPGTKPEKDNNGKYILPREVVRTFIKSTAGYSVISYLLGIGDRHLDNLLLANDGHLFHIDFGFIFGRDPKPLPPPMKIRQEMIDVMGSEGYDQFKQYCCTAYIKLRESANLIINLVSLMRDANIPDMKNSSKAISFLLERFQLGLEDDKVWQYMKDLIVKSETAIFPIWLDHIHTRAQQLRS
eukprot:c20616_g1_i1.p1 GENE.c20616_g1_i1~~c20616_g1_i1.p1  ORF type:complete len:931 (+),score=423.48 c20616_g1_i1:36-2828(+)